MSHWELGSRSRTRRATCLDCSLTVFDTPSSALEQRVNFPRLPKDVGYFELGGGHGVVHPDADGSGHADWWIPATKTAREFYSGRAEV